MKRRRRFKQINSLEESRPRSRTIERGG